MTIKTLDLTAILPGAFTDPSQVVGQIVRQPVSDGAQITTDDVRRRSNGTVIDVQVPAGLRAIAVQVDQITGVGTVIKTGDYVDIDRRRSTADKFASVVPADLRRRHRHDPGLNSTSDKLLLQGMQVLGHAAPARRGTDRRQPSGGTVRRAGHGPQPRAAGDRDPRGHGPAGRGHQFAQLDADPLVTLALILRSPDDFIDPITGQPITPVLDETTGIILKTLVDTVRRPAAGLVETVLPEPGTVRPSIRADPAAPSPRRRRRDRPSPSPVTRRSVLPSPRHKDHPTTDGRPDPRPHRRRHPGDPRSPHEAPRLRERHRRGRRGGVRARGPRDGRPS